MMKVRVWEVFVTLEKIDLDIDREIEKEQYHNNCHNITKECTWRMLAGIHTPVPLAFDRKQA